MANTATRLITLVLLLQQQPNQKAAQLADSLGVSVRTIHRYLSMLDEMGIPVYSERGPYGGFSLVRGYKMPPMVFTPDESVVLYLGASLVGEIWGQLYRPAAQGALAKLDHVLPEEQRREAAWARRSMVAINLLRSSVTLLEGRLEMIRRALREQLRIRMSYRSSQNPTSSQRELDPYALVYRWGWWYLVGYCHLRLDVRSFRVDRIQELALTGQVFKLPENFEIQKYLTMEFKTQPMVQVRLYFEPQYAYIARDDRSYWDEIHEGLDGSVTAIFTAPNLNWAASTVLSYGPIVSILEPAKLRSLVAEWAKAICAQYS